MFQRLKNISTGFMMALLVLTIWVQRYPSPVTAVQAQSCASFPSQAAAQAAYRANPTGLTGLDRDNDGYACEENAPPCDPTPVLRPGVVVETPPDITGIACREEIRTARAATAVPTASATPVPAATPTPSAAVARQDSLTIGCNNVVLTSPAGTSMTSVAANIMPAGALSAIFKYVNETGRFTAYSPAAPDFVNDYAAIQARFEPVFICMTAPGTLTQPAA